MEIWLNLAAAAISLAAAMGGLLAVEWVTRAGRLRRQVEFLRGELAAGVDVDPRAGTLRQMHTEALARLAAIELVPTWNTVRAAGIAVVGFVIAVWFGRELASMVMVGPFDLVTTIMAISAIIGASAYGQEALTHMSRERERVRNKFLDGQAFVPAFTLARRASRPMHVLAAETPVPSFVGAACVLVGGTAIGTMSVTLLDPATLPRDHPLAIAAVTAIPALFVLAALVTLVRGFIRPAPEVTSDQVREILDEESRRLELVWGVVIPTTGPEAAPRKRRHLRIRDLLFAWLLDRVAGLFYSKRK